jgi:hypothetical protein
MPLNVIVKTDTGVIVGYGFCPLTPGVGESVVSVHQDRAKDMDEIKDSAGRLKLKWNSILQAVEEVPEIDRPVHIAPSLIALRAEFKALPTVAEKLQFVARRMGLIE